MVIYAFLSSNPPECQDRGYSQWEIRKYAEGKNSFSETSKIFEISEVYDTSKIFETRKIFEISQMFPFLPQGDQLNIQHCFDYLLMI